MMEIGTEAGNPDKPRRRGWCAAHTRCRGCCIGWAVTLGIIVFVSAVLAIVFWPRLLLICLEYQAIRVTLTPWSGLVPKPSVDIVVPWTIDSSNLWSIEIKKVQVRSSARGGGERAWGSWGFVSIPWLRGSQSASVTHLLTERYHRPQIMHIMHTMHTLQSHVHSTQ